MMQCDKCCVLPLQVNFFAMLVMNEAVAPHMIEQGSGVILNIGSSTGHGADHRQLCTVQVKDI